MSDERKKGAKGPTERKRNENRGSGKPSSGRGKSRGGSPRQPRPRQEAYKRTELALPEVSAGDLKTGKDAFAALGLSDICAGAAAAMGFTAPSAIQEQTIPLTVEGKDIIGLARTGSGKTAAFLLPFLEREGGEAAPAVLILVPTRELAIQVEEQAVLLGRSAGRHVVAVFGGVNLDHQKELLQKKVDIVVATPGRLIDLLERSIVSLGKTSVLILDEADRMLDLGFTDQVMEILRQTPSGRQTMLFSATMPPALERIAQYHIRDGITIDVNPKSIAAESIRQEILEVSLGEKMPKLLKLVEETREKEESVLIFGSTKANVDMIYNRLNTEGYPVGRLHSGLSQDRRMKILAKFRSGQIGVMVATDVAARGLDIPEISLVINYDMPNDVDDYIHRIGRTGRYDRGGLAVSFVAPAERYLIAAIQMALKKGRVDNKSSIPRFRSFRPSRHR